MVVLRLQHAFVTIKHSTKVLPAASFSATARHLIMAQAIVRYSANDAALHHTAQLHSPGASCWPHNRSYGLDSPPNDSFNISSRPRYPLPLPPLLHSVPRYMNAALPATTTTSMMSTTRERPKSVCMKPSGALSSLGWSSPVDEDELASLLLLGPVLLLVGGVGSHEEGAGDGAVLDDEEDESAWSAGKELDGVAVTVDEVVGQEMASRSSAMKVARIGYWLRMLECSRYVLCVLCRKESWRRGRTAFSSSEMVCLGVHHVAPPEALMLLCGRGRLSCCSGTVRWCWSLDAAAALRELMSRMSVRVHTSSTLLLIG